MRYYSNFWLQFASGLIALSPIFAERDAATEHPIDITEMRAWLRLPETERNAIVTGYAFRRPPARTLK